MHDEVEMFRVECSFLQENDRSFILLQWIIGIDYNWYNQNKKSSLQSGITAWNAFGFLSLCLVFKDESIVLFIVSELVKLCTSGY